MDFPSTKKEFEVVEWSGGGGRESVWAFLSAKTQICAFSFLCTSLICRDKAKEGIEVYVRNSAGKANYFELC